MLFQSLMHILMVTRLIYIFKEVVFYKNKDVQKKDFGVLPSQKNLKFKIK